MKPCPFCKEDIHDEAVKCKHCFSTIDPKLPKFEPGSRQVVYFVDQDLVRFVKAAVGVVSLVVAIVAFGFGFNLWLGASSVETMKDKVAKHVERVEAHATTLQSKAESIALLETKAAKAERRVKDAITSVELLEIEMRRKFVDEARVRALIAESETRLRAMLPAGTGPVDPPETESIEIGYPTKRKVPATAELKSALAQLRSHAATATKYLNAFFPKKYTQPDTEIILLENDYKNTFWNGEKVAAPPPMRHLPEIVYHEVSHRYIGLIAGLELRGQSGALSESYADIFAELIDQEVTGKSAATADWIIAPGAIAWLAGSDILTTEPRLPLTSLKAPGTAYSGDPVLGDDKQIGHMRDLYRGPANLGGVHINKGIPNRAFYEVAVQIGSTDARRIWVTALLTLLPKSDFKEAGNATVAAARELFGDASRQVKAVRRAWQTVGVFDEVAAEITAGQ
ncbi:MAG: M4 family metallopeptidase [Gammaproteobacteria bacterium]|nr:M4 family metallopeptidase [Gammaproteobacteria bacterium]